MKLFNSPRRMLRRGQKTSNRSREVKPSASSTFYSEAFRDTIDAYQKSAACIPRDKKISPTVITNIGSARLGDLNRRFLRAYVEKMLAQKTRVGRPFQPSTVAAHLAWIGKVYRWRAEELGAEINATQFSTRLLPKGWDTERERRLGREEEFAIIREMRSERRSTKHHWRMLLVLALETGARLQELALSEWSEFDLTRRLWYIPKVRTKTRQARIVSLSRKACRAVKILRLLRSPASERLFHCFSNPASISAGFHKITLKAKIENFRFHDLRHEAISRMVTTKKGLSPFLVMKMVGHKSMQMLNRYANLNADDMVGLLD